MNTRAMTTIVRVLAVAACLGASTAQAQWTSYKPDQSIFLVGWGLAQGMDKMSDFQSGTSYEGFGLEFRSMLRQSVSAGLAFDYNRFSQTRSLESVQRGNGILSGPTYRYTDQFGIKVTGHFYLFEGAFRPYLGAGIGGDWSYAYVQSADLGQTKQGFYFIFAPEVGLMWNAFSGGTSVGINIAVRYNMTNASFQSVNNAQWLSEIIGISAAY